MKNKLLTLGIVASGIICTSCGSGDIQNTSTPPKGPVSYNYISAAYSDSGAHILSNKMTADDPINCTNPMSVTNWGIDIVKLFTTFIPGPVGTAINTGLDASSDALDIAGSIEGNSCQTVELNIMNQELQQQQQAINQIESTLNLFENNFYVTNMQNQIENTGTKQYLYNSSLQSLSGASNVGIQGLFQTFMIDGGLWNGFQTMPNMDVESIVSNQNNMNKLLDLTSSNTNFTSYLLALSGSSYNASSCSAGNCYQFVVPDTSSAFMELENALYQELLSEVYAGISAGQNVIPLFDQYNQTISSLYLQSAYALQEAFVMEQLVNQINFAAGSSGTQLSSFGNVPSTYFTYGNYSSNESQGFYIQQYNNAQYQLSMMYASRFNQLYQNTISYIVTDSPKGSQSVPNLVINYTYGGNIESDDLSSSYTYLGSNVQTPMQILFSAQNAFSSAFANQTVIYQYSGINDIGQCISSLKGYNESNANSGVLSNALNSQNCSPIFGSANESYNQAYYDGNSLQAYLAISTPSLGGRMVNSIAKPYINNLLVSTSTGACSNNNSLYWYIPDGSATTYANVNTAYVSCGNWSSSVEQILNNFAPNWTMDIQSAYINSVSGWLNWGYSNILVFPENITPVAADSWTYFNTPTDGEVDQPGLGMSGTSANGVSLDVLAVGNMPTNYVTGNPYSVHQMAFQTTAADGFVSSFVLQFFNHATWNGNYIGITCNQNLNKVGFYNVSTGSVDLIQTACNQTTNNPSSVSVNYTTFNPPTVYLGGSSGAVWQYYSVYNF
ncbi:MAG: hypothetical protein PHC75_06815 [Burkholderiales bacterium]|nr:hypothetical protein [Burkholderiales bacterium]